MWQPYAESRLVTSAGCRFHRLSELGIHHRARIHHILGIHHRARIHHILGIHHRATLAAHTRPRCGVWRIIANVRRSRQRRCTRGLAREETCEPGSKVEDGAGDVTAGDYQCLETVRSRIELRVYTLQQQDIKTSRISSAVTGMCQCEGHK